MAANRDLRGVEVSGTAGKGGKPRQPRPVRKLSRRLDVARQLHALEQDNALEIVDIERLRVSVTRSLWLFLVIGSVFTTTGVHAFLAGRLAMSDPVWWGCWGVEPCMVGILITMLRWEAAMITRDIEVASRAVAWLKRFLLLSTLIMNVASALCPTEGGISPGMLAAHFMVPILVFFLAEVMPVVQARCTQARRAVALPAPVMGGSTVEATRDAPAPVPAPLSASQVVSVSVPASVVREPEIDDTVASVPPAEPPGAALDGLGIPAGIQAQIRRLVAEVDGSVTAADIHRATRLPLSIANKVADRLALVGANGYAH